jgi:hypothetical protein
MERFQWNISKFLSVREDLCARLLYAKQFSIERLPYQEGWRPPAQPITLQDLNHPIFNLIQANEHKSAEDSRGRTWNGACSTECSHQPSSKLLRYHVNRSALLGHWLCSLVIMFDGLYSRRERQWSPVIIIILLLSNALPPGKYGDALAPCSTPFTSVTSVLPPSNVAFLELDAPVLEGR